MKPLEGRVALVAGATRGAGRGIACMLGEAGATVYCTGRSTRGQSAMKNRPECVEDTADMVTARGGTGRWMRVDHLREEEVAELVSRIAREEGRLDLLINDIWGGDELTEWGKPFWELDAARGWQLLERAMRTHLITSRHAVPLMRSREGGLIIEVTDGEGMSYRGNHYYDLAKTGVIRMAKSMALELKSIGMTALALTPGFLRSEAVLDHFGVTSESWRDAIVKDPHFAFSESVYFIGRAVAALAADPEVGRFNGTVQSTWRLAGIYGFTDADGGRPDWGGHLYGLVADALMEAASEPSSASDSGDMSADAVEKKARAALDMHELGFLGGTLETGFFRRLKELGAGASREAVYQLVLEELASA